MIFMRTPFIFSITCVKVRSDALTLQKLYHRIKFMKIIKTILIILSAILGFIGLICFFSIIFRDEYYSYGGNIDTALASNFGDFIGGFVGTIFSIIGVLLIILTLIYQIIENRKTAITNQFFKMLDYHYENINNIHIKGIQPLKDNPKKYEKVDNRRAFVIFKLQLQVLLQKVEEINIRKRLNFSKDDIIDIAYIAFYYGIDNEWSEFSESKLKKYDPYSQEIYNELLEFKRSSDKKVGRTNQTSLSAYYRNMYNAIKLIDESCFLTKKEKKNYVKIFRAQLSNPELYVLFFNLASRFGQKWKYNNYVIKYEFIKNLPLNYCSGYNPKEFFPMQYEEEELS